MGEWDAIANAIALFFVPGCLISLSSIKFRPGFSAMLPSIIMNLSGQAGKNGNEAP
jgi:hypothetical protein